MRLRLHHRATATAAALFTASILTIGGGTARAWAASPPPTHTAAPARPATFIASKVVLPQTSIDGPGLSSVFGSFEGQSFNKSAIAWAGTDPAHHLNVETSTDGLHFGNQRILDETSAFRPDVTQVAQPAGGEISVAWTGTDPNRSLNVLFDVYGTSPKKLTLRDNSFTAPAILQRGGTLFLAWAGTDPNHSLNVLQINLTPSGLAVGTKTILPQFSSNAGPHLAQRGGTTIVLNWTSRALQPTVATSVDGVHFSNVARLPEASAFAPDTVSFQSEAGPGDWIGWTGTDPAHHLNLQWTTSFPQFPNPAATKTVLGDTAFGGPALAFNAGPQIAWTGTDPAHHLNVAKFAFA